MIATGSSDIFEDKNVSKCKKNWRHCDIDLARAGNTDALYKQGTLRMAKCESRGKAEMCKNCDLLDMMAFVESGENKEFRYVQKVCNTFTVAMFCKELWKYLRTNKEKRLVHVDATGNVVRPPTCKRILYTCTQV